MKDAFMERLVTLIDYSTEINDLTQELIAQNIIDAEKQPNGRPAYDWTPKFRDHALNYIKNIKASDFSNKYELIHKLIMDYLPDCEPSLSVRLVLYLATAIDAKGLAIGEKKHLF